METATVSVIGANSEVGALTSEAQALEAAGAS
jgi:hypothetical protein